MNKYTIELKEDKQPLFKFIYSLKPVKLETLKTLKTYIKTILANGFIRSSKSFAGAPFLFDKKLDRSLHFCVNYWGLINLIIKNQYSLSLTGELLDQHDWTKQFIQSDLINAYYWMRIHKNNEWKTAFRIRYGYFKYQVIFFSLSKTLATF